MANRTCCVAVSRNLDVLVLKPKMKGATGNGNGRATVTDGRTDGRTDRVVLITQTLVFSRREGKSQVRTLRVLRRGELTAGKCNMIHEGKSFKTAGATSPITSYHPTDATHHDIPGIFRSPLEILFNRVRGETESKTARRIVIPVWAIVPTVPTSNDR